MASVLPGIPDRVVIAALLTLGVIARAATFQSALFDFHSWRQADTAMIARNFVEERFDIRYPQIDQRGAREEGYVETGLELYAFLLAAISRVVGFSPYVGRLLNTFLFPWAAALLYRFARDRYGTRIGLLCLYIYSIGLPLLVYIDRAVMNESLLMLLSVASLRAAQLHLQRPRAATLARLVIGSMAIAAMKPTFLVIWGALAGLYIERFGRKVVVRWELWGLLALTVSAAVLWFRHAHGLYEMTGLTFGVDDKLFSLSIVESPRYWFKIATRLFKDILGPVAFLAVPFGTVWAVRRRHYAEALGLVTFLVYLVVVTIGNATHNYYQLPIVPVAAVLAALGIAHLVDRFIGNEPERHERRVLAFAVTLWLVAMSTFVRSAAFHSWYEVDKTRVQACDELRPSLVSTDRVAFANYHSPDLLFCVHRKGWLLSEPATTQDALRDVIRQGASVIVTQRQYQATIETLQRLGGQRVVETPEFVAYRFSSSKTAR
jgi:hypothetical protein